DSASQGFSPFLHVADARQSRIATMGASQSDFSSSSSCTVFVHSRSQVAALDIISHIHGAGGGHPQSDASAQTHDPQLQSLESRPHAAMVLQAALPRSGPFCASCSLGLPDLRSTTVPPHAVTTPITPLTSRPRPKKRHAMRT